MSFNIIAVVQTSDSKAVIRFLHSMQVDKAGGVTADWHTDAKPLARFKTKAMAEAIACLLVECGLCLDADAVEARS